MVKFGKKKKHHQEIVGIALITVAIVTAIAFREQLSNTAIWAIANLYFLANLYYSAQNNTLTVTRVVEISLVTVISAAVMISFI